MNSMKNFAMFLEIADTSIDDSLRNLMPLISQERQFCIEKYRFDIDKKLSLCAELLVRLQACKILSIKNEEIIFEKNKYGKPYVKGYQNFQFNISHTRNAIAVAFSNKDIVDVEKIKMCDFNIANRFFDLMEKNFIRKALNKNKTFFEIWTKKEAYIKCEGKGLSIPLSSFCILDKDLNARIITHSSKGLTSQISSVKTNKLQKGYTKNGRYIQRCLLIETCMQIPADEYVQLLDQILKAVDYENGIWYTHPKDGSLKFARKPYSGLSHICTRKKTYSSREIE